MRIMLLFVMAVCLSSIIGFPLCSRAAMLPLREEISLNGTWPVGGIVPSGGGRGRGTEMRYERSVDVPPAWSGKRIHLEFEMVNHVCDVFINDKPLGNHVGGYIPFAYDVTSLVQPGKSFRLRVEVKGPNVPPIINAAGHAVWPIGGGGGSGIVDNVWLRAYGPIYIEDSFIQTSYRKSSLTVDYTLVNADVVARSVSLAGTVLGNDGNSAMHPMPTQTVMLTAGERKHIIVTSAWKDVHYWTPDTPTLYYLRSQLLDGATVVDMETRRFGFREVWIEGNQYMLNGVRYNVWGDNIWGSRAGDAQYWAKTIDVLKHELNMRIVRLHTCPGPSYMLDVADEKGFFVIDESAAYSSTRQYDLADAPFLVDNMVRFWVAPWVIAKRNHPSLFMWSAMNEMIHVGPYFTKEQCLLVGSVVHQYDPTRPVTYDGDDDVGDQVINSRLSGRL